MAVIFFMEENIVFLHEPNLIHVAKPGLAIFLFQPIKTRKQYGRNHGPNRLSS